MIRWREIREYRDLFSFLIWRDIKVRYAQSVLGIGWAVIQPVFSMLVFTVVFSRMAGVRSDGVPYVLFSFAALVPWTFFSNALSDSSMSLVTNSSMLQKIYFPRVMLPAAAVLGKLVDFGIGMVLLLTLMAWYRVVPSTGVLLLPLLIALLVITALGIGLVLSGLAVQYRDVKYALVFGLQLLMFAAPVVYPASYVPDHYRLWYGLNPMVAVIEGFRSALLGTTALPWDFISMGFPTGLLILAGGLVYFHQVEHRFADVA
jgi:lipopolysaccharide transport system permease protein